MGLKDIRKFIPFPIVLAIITAIFTYRKLTLEQPFFEHWIGLYGLVLLVVFPIVIIAFPKFNRFIGGVLGDKHLVIQGFAFVIPMISIVGSLITGLSIVAWHKFQTSQEFFQLWGSELQNNVPIFMGIAVVFGGILKPIITKRTQRSIH